MLPLGCAPWGAPTASAAVGNDTSRAYDSAMQLERTVCPLAASNSLGRARACLLASVLLR